MSLIRENREIVEAFAPATCANVAVGFDILGFAFHALGDKVKLRKKAGSSMTIASITGDKSLPLDPKKNTASVALHAFAKALALPFGFLIDIQKGIPLCSGMGGSAASAVAALLAANQFLENPLSLEQLIPFALLAEKAATGVAHADNIVPALFGGLTLIASHHPIQVLSLPLPKVYCVLLHPEIKIPTRDARKMLSKRVWLQDHVAQSAGLAAFIAALYTKNQDLVLHSLKDRIIEPQRAELIPYFRQVKEAAFDVGALNFSISGSGPAVFSFTKDREKAKIIAQNVSSLFKDKGISCRFWIRSLAQKGAYHAVSI